MVFQQTSPQGTLHISVTMMAGPSGAPHRRVLGVAAGFWTWHPSVPTVRGEGGRKDGQEETPRRADRRLGAARAAVQVARAGALRVDTPPGVVRLFSDRARHKRSALPRGRSTAGWAA